MNTILTVTTGATVENKEQNRVCWLASGREERLVEYGNNDTNRIYRGNAWNSRGNPRIAGHRITMQDIAIWHERLGRTADEIATEYDLTLEEVYVALTFCFDQWV
jgi:uncharacterized protein (DUF433 family)